MKKVYVTPRVVEERFEANEYVASCIEATATCAIPGTYADKVGDGNKPTRKDSTNMEHGICGNDGAITFTTAGASGYETINGVIQKNRPIHDIMFGTDLGTGSSAKSSTFSALSGSSLSLDSLQPNHYYSAAWKSDDNVSHSGTYSHYGLIYVTLVDKDRPNHS